MLISSFAEDDSLIVEADKAEYEIGDSMVISGLVGEIKMPVVALKIFDPNGRILSANQVYIEDDNTFSKIIELDSPFYDTQGTYSIALNYGKLETETTFEMVIEDIDDSILEDDFDFFGPEILSMFTDKEVYQDGDTVTIIGLVSDKDQDSVLIGIYDPFGTPTGFYFGDVGSNLEFSVSFLVKAGVNFKTEGIYSISAFYSESEEYTIFEYVEQIQTIELEIINDEKPVKLQEKIVKEKKVQETIPSKNIEKTEDKIPSKPKSQNNLSVEDIELGIMLNQINLRCDTSEFVDTISYYDSMGPALIRLCKYAEAIYYYDQSLIADPNNVEILTNKGSALAKMHFYDEAIIHYDSALVLEPNNFQALNNKANALANLQNYDEAILTYNKALATAPGNPIIWNNFETAKTKSIIFIGDQSVPLEAPQIFEQEKNLVVSSNQETISIFDQIGNLFSSIFSFLS